MARRRRSRPHTSHTVLHRLMRSCRYAFLALLGAPLAVQLFASVLLLVAGWCVVNWAYQIARKPTELFYPISGSLAKAPAETWRQYHALFDQHSTPVMTPPFLAALAQVEGMGNPLAHTYWRSSLTMNPLQLYYPASSAVGMFQMTDGAFREAKRYCIHHHQVVTDGPWHDTKSCWLNSLYTRVLPSHAIELTAAHLDRAVTAVMRRRGIAAAPLNQRQALAAVIHLCGARVGEAYAARGFRMAPGQRCGDHDVGRYLARVNAMKRTFTRLAASKR